MAPVTQEAINMFADATLDHQWIHVDRQGKAGIAFRRADCPWYYTLSLRPT